MMLAENPELNYRFEPGLLKGVGLVQAKGYALKSNLGGTIDREEVIMTAIPYYSWAHRGNGEMTVWIPEDEAYASPLPAPTIASKAAVSSSECKGSLSTVNDQLVPTKSSSAEYGHIHWWPKKKTTEWLQYDFADPEEVSSIRVFWFDDEDLNAGCRVPASWKLLYKKGNSWLEVEPKGEYGLEKDKFNELEFRPVKTRGLKLVIVQQDDWSTGVQEWVVN